MWFPFFKCVKSPAGADFLHDLAGCIFMDCASYSVPGTGPRKADFIMPSSQYAFTFKYCYLPPNIRAHQTTHPLGVGICLNSSEDFDLVQSNELLPPNCNCLCRYGVSSPYGQMRDDIGRAWKVLLLILKGSTLSPE